MAKWKVKPEYIGTDTIVMVDKPDGSATIVIKLDTATQEELDMIMKAGNHHMITEDKKQA